MTIRVVTGTATASASSIKPRASVSVVAPVLGITVQVPVSKIDYIDLSVGAFLDNSGRFKFFKDATAVTDRVSLLLAKSPTEVVSVADSSTRSFDKAQSDSVGVLDTLVRTLIFLRSFDETVEISDAVSLLLSRPVDPLFVEVTDESFVETEKVLRSLVDFLDEKAIDFHKQRTSAFSLSDFVSLTPGKSASSSITTSETTLYGLSKLINESFGFTHQVNRSVSRFISDGFAMNDSAETADGLFFQSSKSVVNVVFPVDGQVIVLSKQLTEAPILFDAGSLISQGYCDLTYFAEDYVGESRTF